MNDPQQLLKDWDLIDEILQFSLNFIGNTSVCFLTTWRISLRENCPYSELFWSAFSRIWTEYGEVLHISPYSVRTQENANQNNSEYGRFLRSVLFLVTFAQIDSLKEKKLEKGNV